jgi:hypothetical protein
MKIQPNEPMCYAGYIAPNGDLYSCPREGHRTLAMMLARRFYPHADIYQAEQILHENGWLKLRSDGQVSWSALEGQVTQKQLNKLGDILTCDFHNDPPSVIRDFHASGDRYIHGTPEGWQRNINLAIFLARV